MCYSLWWTIGSFFAYIALQLLNRKNPNIWLTPIYTQWAQIGIMCLIYVFLPESPAWCVSRGNADRAKKQLLRLNRGVSVSTRSSCRRLSMRERSRLSRRRSTGMPSFAESMVFELSSRCGRTSPSNSLALPFLRPSEPTSSSKPAWLTLLRLSASRLLSTLQRC
ncbi:hypothetical protein LB505_013181 [Fusarium chuoi]|nr:hypothetical protein LB505_013181 [Fusarium chuoi]